METHFQTVLYSENYYYKKKKHGYKKKVQGEITFLNSNEKKIIVRIS